jgi:hypothetical protein
MPTFRGLDRTPSEEDQMNSSVLSICGRFSSGMELMPTSEATVRIGKYSDGPAARPAAMRAGRFSDGQEAMPEHEDNARIGSFADGMSRLVTEWGPDPRDRHAVGVNGRRNG